MFYSCAQEEPDKAFQIFPTSDVDERAAIAYGRVEKVGLEEYFCVMALLRPEEEATAYQKVLLSTLDRVIGVAGDKQKRLQRYRRILSETYKEIQRRGGSRDQSLCPYLYERPTDAADAVSFCRVVKKPCYLTIYQMPGFLQCPRYLRRQRRIQLRNARRLVRAGIQRILAESDGSRQSHMKTGTRTWSNPIYAILDRLFAVLQVSSATTDQARQIVKFVEEKGLFQGHPRPIIAASIAYVSGKQTGDTIPENDIIELIGCSRTSLRRNCRELQALLTAGEQSAPQPRSKRRPSRRQKAISRAE